MLSSISKPPDQISKLETLARVQAAVVTLIGDMIDAPAMQTNTNISRSIFSFDRPSQGIDVPFPSFKGDVLVEVERNIPRGCLLRIKICLKKKRGLFNKRLQRISTSTTLIFNWTFAPPVQPFESNQLQSGVAWPIFFD